MQRDKSPGRKVKVTDMITQPTAQTAEPRCSERDTSQVERFCPGLQHWQLLTGLIVLSIQHLTVNQTKTAFQNSTKFLRSLFSKKKSSM